MRSGGVDREFHGPFRICNLFSQGSCMRRSCNFAHGPEEQAYWTQTREASRAKGTFPPDPAAAQYAAKRNMQMMQAIGAAPPAAGQSADPWAVAGITSSPGGAPSQPSPTAAALVTTAPPLRLAPRRLLPGVPAPRCPP